MFNAIILIFISFFAVIGFTECVLTILESVSVSKYRQVKSITLSVELSGVVDNPSFLLNTLSLQADRIRYGDTPTTVLIKDCGIDENTYMQISDFCLENDNIEVEK